MCVYRLGSMSVRRGPTPGGPPTEVASVASVASVAPSEGFSLLFSRESLLGVNKSKEKGVASTGTPLEESDVVTPPLHLLASKAKPTDAPMNNETINVSIRYGLGSALDPSVYYAIQAAHPTFNSEMAAFWITVDGNLRDTRPIMAAAIKKKIDDLFSSVTGGFFQWRDMAKVMPHEEVNSCSPNRTSSTWVIFTVTPPQAQAMDAMIRDFRTPTLSPLKNICNLAFGMELGMDNMPNPTEFRIGDPATIELWQRSMMGGTSDAENDLIRAGALLKCKFTFRNQSSQDSDALRADNSDLYGKNPGKRRKPY